MKKSLLVNFLKCSGFSTIGLIVTEVSNNFNTGVVYQFFMLMVLPNYQSIVGVHLWSVLDL